MRIYKHIDQPTHVCSMFYSSRTIRINSMLAVSLSLFDDNNHTNLLVAYVTRSSLVAADLIVLVLTWTKTFGSWKEARRLNVELSVSTCLLRDGKSLCIVLRVCIH